MNEALNDKMIDDSFNELNHKLKSELVLNLSPSDFSSDISNFVVGPEGDSTERLRKLLEDAIFWRRNMLDTAKRSQWEQARNGSVHMTKLAELGSHIVETFMAQTDDDS